MERLIENIKTNEGFRGEVYKDSLGFDTLGYGTKLPLSKSEASMLLISRLDKKIEELLEKKPFVKELDEIKQEVLYEMAYQLGVGGLLGFKKMWLAIERGDFKKAASEMLDSKWAKQTPLRANHLAQKIQI